MTNSNQYGGNNHEPQTSSLSAKATQQKPLARLASAADLISNIHAGAGELNEQSHNGLYLLAETIRCALLYEVRNIQPKRRPEVEETA